MIPPSEPRPDLDVPGENDAYVIRLEAADGRRLKTTASHAEIERAGGEGTAALLAAKAEALINAFAIGSDYAPLRDENAVVDFMFASEPENEKLVAWAEKYGVEVRPMSDFGGKKTDGDS